MIRRDFIKTSVLGAGLLGINSSAIARLIDGSEGNTPAAHCLLPSHRVPVLAQVDLLVVGGSSAAVAAAVAAATSGATVFLVAPLPYLGDELCGCLNLWLPENRNSKPEALFGSGDKAVKPLHVKTVLEDMLIEAGVGFVYSSYFVETLYSDRGKAGGGLIVNRSGCQAVCARAIVDATLDATVARCSRLPMKSLVQAKQKYEYTVVGNTAKEHGSITGVDTQTLEIHAAGKPYSVLRYTFEFDDAGKDFALLNNVEQQIRDVTWDAGQVDSSDLLWSVPSQQISGCGQNSLAEQCRSKAISNLYVVSGYADVSRDTAASFRQCSLFMQAGMEVGSAAAARAKAMAAPNPARVSVVRKKTAAGTAKAGENVSKLRPSYGNDTVTVDELSLPVLAHFDIVILGGGTAGAAAGVSASRQGAKTLTVEYLHALGGIMTAGLIGRYWDGFREGFTGEVDAGVCAMAPQDHPRRKKNCTAEWTSDWKMEWFRKEIRKAHGDVWFGATGCGVALDGNRVCGVVIATPYGRGVVTGTTIIDSTGAADLAVAAGAGYENTDAKTVATQGAGLCKRSPNDFYNNNDWTFIDDTDILDVSRVFVAAKAKYRGEYDLCKIPQTRERRRVVAEHNVSVQDVINERRYPDTISYHVSSFDTHGFTVDPYFTLKPPERVHRKYSADVPLRTLLPKGLDGIIVTGLGAGAHRDAMPVIRMQPCLQNQGYAAGYLAAAAVRENKSVRQIDLRKIQEHLVSIGNLPQRVLTDSDNFPFADQSFEQAASTLHNNMEGLEILMTDTQRAIPLLRKHYRAKAGSAQALNYAHTLAILGDASGFDELLNAVNSHSEWDTGWHYTGMGQFGPCMSRLDSLIIALGNTRKKEALPAIVAHAGRLKAESSFSHFRSVCMAVETIGDSAAAPVLAGIIVSCNLRSEAVTDYRKARNAVNGNNEDTSIRNRVLKELHLARALYRCGDHNQLGKTILTEYANDLHAHYARHAELIMNYEL